MSGKKISSVGEYVTWEGQKDILLDYAEEGLKAMEQTLRIYFSDYSYMASLFASVLKRCEDGYVVYGHKLFEKSVMELTGEFVEEITDALAYMIVAAYVADARGVFAARPVDAEG